MREGGREDEDEGGEGERMRKGLNCCPLIDLLNFPRFTDCKYIIYC